jgi:hypothetical protein
MGAPKKSLNRNKAKSPGKRKPLTVGSVKSMVVKLRKDVVENFEWLSQYLQGLTKDMVRLGQNDKLMLDAHDTLADMYYGTVDLLRDSDPKMAELLTDERILVAANNRRKMRLEKQKAEQEKAEKEAELKRLAEAAESGDTGEENEELDEHGVPKDATVFGGNDGQADQG